jgi:hypothetical protein
MDLSSVKAFVHKYFEEFADIFNRMNYNYAIWICKKYRLQDSLSDDFSTRQAASLPIYA